MLYEPSHFAKFQFAGLFCYFVSSCSHEPRITFMNSTNFSMVYDSQIKVKVKVMPVISQI
jgi:hypothetical protein